MAWRDYRRVCGGERRGDPCGRPRTGGEIFRCGRNDRTGRAEQSPAPTEPIQTGGNRNKKRPLRVKRSFLILLYFVAAAAAAALLI